MLNLETSCFVGFNDLKNMSGIPSKQQDWDSFFCLIFGLRGDDWLTSCIHEPSYMWSSLIIDSNISWLTAACWHEQVPLFDQMDEQMLDAICERLKPALCTQGMRPSAWGWPRQRDAIHHPRPPRLLHHQRWPYRFLQLMSYWAGWFLWWGVADMGLGSTAKCHPPIIHTYSQGHIWGGGLRAHSGRFEVCSVTVSKDA